MLPFFYFSLNTYDMQEFIVDNWVAIAAAALVFGKAIANLTKTEGDNRLFEFLDIAINYFVPPRKRK